MIWIILIVIIVIVIIFNLNNEQVGNKQLNQKQVVEIDVPNPENSNPKKVIEFINDYEPSVIKQTYDQLIGLNKQIPKELKIAFEDKIKNGYIIKENYLWSISIEEIKVEQDNLIDYTKRYSFEVKGLQINAYKERLKNSIIYDEVYLESEPKNKFDKNAIKVETIDGLIGYVPANETSEVKKIMETDYKAYIENVTNDDGFINAYIEIYHK